VTSDLLENREWLIQPDALHAMAATTQAFHDRGGQLPASAPTSELLSIEHGIGVVAINGPILRKPGIFSRLFLATTHRKLSVPLHSAGKAIGGRIRNAVKWTTRHKQAPGSAVLKTGDKASVSLVNKLNYIEEVSTSSS
jgi:hypothetical protein